jgi:hypothetical protein
VKRCTECGQPKDEREFYSNGRGGLFANCKECFKQKQTPRSLGRYYTLKAAGVCPSCKGDSRPGKVYCAECQTGHQDAKAQRRAMEVPA